MTEVFGLSDVGCLRELNEDSFCVHGFENGTEKGFCIIADGMGGHNAGEVASQNAVKFIAEDLMISLDEASTDIPGKLREAVEKANGKVYEMSKANIVQSGMGTTVVLCYIDNSTAYIANVGDSRAYAIRNDEIVRITVDHSVVEEMVLRGSITREEARNHPRKNIITRAVGTDFEVMTDIFEYSYSKGDMMILCSDGLCNMIYDDEILSMCKTGKNAEDICKGLVKAAKDNGGLDNITVVCICF